MSNYFVSSFLVERMPAASILGFVGNEEKGALKKIRLILIFDS